MVTSLIDDDEIGVESYSISPIQIASLRMGWYWGVLMFEESRLGDDEERVIKANWGVQF